MDNDLIVRWYARKIYGFHIPRPRTHMMPQDFGLAADLYVLKMTTGSGI